MVKAPAPRFLFPDLASSLQIAVTEEVHGQRYVIRKTGTNKIRSIKTDIPHPAGYWEFELLNVDAECLYFGVFAVPLGTKPSLDVWQRACSDWIAADEAIPPSNVMHGFFKPGITQLT